MEIVASVVTELGKCIATLACNYVDRCRRFKHDIDVLKEGTRDLKSLKEDIETQLRSAEALPGKVVRKQVEDWLLDVERITGEIAEIEKEAENVSCFLRARRGKHVREKIAQVEKIAQRGSFPVGLVIDEPATAGMTLPTEKLEGGIDVKKQIWDCFLNDEMGVIGLYGIGGVGKTSIMKHVNNELLKETSGFSKVIWVTVSHPLNVARLQCSIAEKITGKKLPEDRDELDLASDLLRLMEGVRYALILDDVWDKFPLGRVGIPKPTKDNGCKILITSRSADVCNYFGCHKIKVQPLSEQESMNLFLNKVGQDVLLDPDVMEVLELVVKECDGLPLAIVVIAASMKGVRDIHEWRDALRELRSCVAGTMKDSEDEIFNRLKFSYDRLRDSEIQNCFLYFSLFPEDYTVYREWIIEEWIDEGLIRELGSRLQKKDKGHTIVNRLENNCLIEGDGNECFKMHDVVRDMALRIKSNNAAVMVKGRMKLKEIPAEDDWIEDLEKVFLMENDITYIPPNMSPKCLKLSTLRLEGNQLRQIPECFFKYMVKLQFINLSSTRIETLPKSICDLENLTTLLLSGCKNLKHVPSLENLKALKKLDLTGSGIEVLPEGIGTLVNLQFLGLYCRNLVELPSGLFINLSRLQYLGLYHKGSSSYPRISLRVEEIAALKRLEELQAHFCKIQDLKNYINHTSNHFGGPSKYRVKLGACPDGNLISIRDYEDGTRITYCLSRHASLGECEVGGDKDSLVLPDDLQSLHILNCGKNESCRVSECGGLEFIVDMASPHPSFINNIEVLYLRRLSNLRALVKVEEATGGSLSSSTVPRFFSNLTTLCISSCSRMKKLLPFQLLGDLHSLKYLRVDYCEEMEDITSYEGGGSNHTATTTLTLPNLKIFHMSNLPALRRICPEGVVIVCDSLDEVQISYCPELKRIPLVGGNGQPFPTTLKEIKIDSEERWDSLEWDNPDVKHALRPFIKFQNH